MLIDNVSYSEKKNSLRDKVVLIATIFVSVVVWGGSSFAAEGKTKTLLAIMELSPYGFYDEKGNSTGYLYDVGDTILKNLGVPGNPPLLPLKRLVHMLKTEEVDCTLLAATSFTRSNYRLIEPIGHMLTTGIFPKAGIKLSEYEDLQGLAIAIPGGVRISDRFDQDDSLNKISTKGYRQSVLMLENGRVDAIVGVWGSYVFNVLELGFEPNKIFGTPLIFKKIPIWLVCRQDGPSPQDEEKLKTAVAKLKKDGAIKRTIEKYLGQQ